MSFNVGDQRLLINQRLLSSNALFEPNFHHDPGDHRGWRYPLGLFGVGQPRSRAIQSSGRSLAAIRYVNFGSRESAGALFHAPNNPQIAVPGTRDVCLFLFCLNLGPLRPFGPLQDREG